MVSSLNNNEIDFRISFEANRIDEDYTNEFPAIVYNDALTSKSNSSTKPIEIHHRIDEFDLKDETSLSKYDEDEQNVLYFNDLSPFNIIYLDDLKSDNDNDDNEIDRIQSSGDMALSPRDQRHYRAWRRLFEIQGLLVHELILEFFSTFRFGEAVVDLDTARALQLITCSIVGRSQAPEKVTVSDLFYLRGMDVGSVNVPYLLSNYLSLFASRRKQGAMISGGQFVAHLAEHFGFVRSLMLCAPEATKDAPVVDEGALDDLAPMLEEEVHELRQSNVGLRGDVNRSITDQSKFATWMVSCMTQLMDASDRTYQAFDSTLIGSSRLPYQRCTRHRTGDANTSTT
ncbi:hypothetical protein Tco_0506784 [Tanacetum coccineum]